MFCDWLMHNVFSVFPDTPDIQRTTSHREIFSAGLPEQDFRMLHRDKQEYHEHLFSGVSGLFLSWSVVLSLNMLHRLHHSRNIPPDMFWHATAHPFSRTGHSFYRQILNTESPPALPADIQLQGQLINTWFSPRRRFNNKKHAGWLMINILVINIRRYP